MSTTYLEAIRDVERRIQLAEEQSSRELPTLERPAGGFPASYEDYAKLMIDLQLHERKIPESHQGRPLRADIVDGGRDIMKLQLSCDVDHEIQIVDRLGAVDLD